MLEVDADLLSQQLLPREKPGYYWREKGLGCGLGLFRNRSVCCEVGFEDLEKDDTRNESEVCFYVGK